MPALSILVPVYNEAHTIASVMEAIVAACPDAQVVYVDDGSSDGSLAILQANARPEDLVIAAAHGGKGSAIREGLKHVSGTFTVIQDADLEYDPKEIRLLLERARSQPGSAVFGSRFLRNNPNIYKRFLMGNKVLTFAMNTLFRSHLTDSYTCYKMLPSSIFRSLGLASNGFELEAEICGKCLRRGIPVFEVPISYKPRTIEEGKKIKWTDAVRGLAMMVAVRMEKRRKTED